MWSGGFDSIQKCSHGRREITLKEKSFSSNRVHKTKGFRVKGLSRDEREEFLNLPFLTRRSGAGNDPSPAIRWISEHRMSDVRQVNPDLMGPTREEFQTYMSKPGKLLFHGIRCDRVFPSRDHGDLLSVRLAPAEFGFY
jgi:hypothetical protein